MCCKQVAVVNLLTYLRHRNLISKHQHGFLSGISRNTYILESLADRTLTLKTGTYAHHIYVDYAKAFDTVYHNKLCYKLRSFDINYNLLVWIQDLLTDRTQRTRIGASLSGSSNLISGVIQGVIGPLLLLSDGSMQDSLYLQRH